MFSIGAFARHGQVDAHAAAPRRDRAAATAATRGPGDRLSLVRARQLLHLNRIVALKDQGFTLEHVRSGIDDTVSAEELRCILTLRQAKLQAQIAADGARQLQEPITRA